MFMAWTGDPEVDKLIRVADVVSGVYGPEHSATLHLRGLVAVALPTEITPVEIPPIEQ